MGVGKLSEEKKKELEPGRAEGATGMRTPGANGGVIMGVEVISGRVQTLISNEGGRDEVGTDVTGAVRTNHDNAGDDRSSGSGCTTVHQWGEGCKPTAGASLSQSSQTRRVEPQGGSPSKRGRQGNDQEGKNVKRAAIPT